MKAAFIFDTKLIENEKDYYGMTLTYDFFRDKYLCFFDEIVVGTRVEKNKNIKEYGYSKTNGDKVIVNPIRSYSKVSDAILKNKEVTRELELIINNADKIIIRMPSVLGIIACDICKEKNKDYIIEMVACAWDGYMNHSNLLGKTLAPFMYMFTKQKIYEAPNVIYVTDTFLQKRYPTKGNSYSCSDVILQKINDNVLANRIQRIKNMNSNELRIITVANVEMKYKGHIYVIKALSKLKKVSDLKFKYVLVGNGNCSYLKRIAKKYKIEEDIEFLGSLVHEQVFNILETCDIYIQPSLQEGLPRAVVEAMSMALPIFGSNCGGIPELLSSNVIFKKRNVTQIVNILKNINKEQLICMAKENYNNSQSYNYEYLRTKRNVIMKEFINK